MTDAELLPSNLRLQSRFIATAVSAGFTILAFSRHATVCIQSFLYLSTHKFFSFRLFYAHVHHSQSSYVKVYKGADSYVWNFRGLKLKFLSSLSPFLWLTISQTDCSSAFLQIVTVLLRFTRKLWEMIQANISTCACSAPVSVLNFIGCNCTV
jgi:hypothetical protein